VDLAALAKTRYLSQPAADLLVQMLLAFKNRTTQSGAI